MQGARKGSHNYSILQGKSKRCYFTDTETGPLERHRIYFGAGMRQISDKHGFWVWLKPEWHRGTSGVHGRDGHKVDLRLKQDCQRKFEETHTREEFMAIIGRNYLSDEAEQKKRRCLRIRVNFIYCRRYEHGQRNRIQHWDRGLPLLRMPREDCRLPWDV